MEAKDDEASQKLAEAEARARELRDEALREAQAKAEQERLLAEAKAAAEAERLRDERSDAERECDACDRGRARGGGGRQAPRAGANNASRPRRSKLERSGKPSEAAQKSVCEAAAEALDPVGAELLEREREARSQISKLEEEARLERGAARGGRAPRRRGRAYTTLLEEQLKEEARATEAASSKRRSGASTKRLACRRGRSPGTTAG